MAKKRKYKKLNFVQKEWNKRMKNKIGKIKKEEAQEDETEEERCLCSQGLHDKGKIDCPCQICHTNINWAEYPVAPYD
jgi:hypothetical protein